jgi:uncharacterized protein
MVMTTKQPAKRWLVDTSVLLRAALGDSPAADKWLAEQKANQVPLVGSKLLATESHRAVLNRKLAGMDVDSIDLAGYLSGFSLGRLDDALADEAAAINQPLRTADAIHLATALRLGIDEVGIATHDAQMSAAAEALGFTVIDPVTDDPNRPPVSIKAKKDK